jgi:hypothetical protein
MEQMELLALKAIQVIKDHLEMTERPGLMEQMEPAHMILQFRMGLKELKKNGYYR